jgi:mitochondrial fission protein ELM1
LTRERPGASLRIWALLGARAGDNDQVIALAEALGLPFEIKQLEYNGLRRLGPRLLGRSLISLTRNSRDLVLREPPPDLTISTGHRSVAVVRALRHRSRGRTRSIHVGFPRVSPARFDLVIATPQYPIPDHPRLLRVPYALTRAATAAADPADRARLASLPAPRRLLIVGGPTLFWKLPETDVLRTLAAMLDEAREAGGSVLVTTSPRTPPALEQAIAQALDVSGVPTLLAAPRKPPSYVSLLEAADSIRVTADSVAMVSDSIWTGKPVALVPVTRSVLGRVVIPVMDRIRPGQRLYPQDLRYFWSALAGIGVTERLGTPRASTDDEMRKVLDRVRPILDELHIQQQGVDLAKRNGGRGKD